MEKAIRRYWPIFVLPTLAAFCVGFIYPFVQGLYLSFCKFTTIKKATFNGLDNYAYALGDGEFWHSFWFTALFTVVSTALINIIAFAIALALTNKIKGSNLFRTVFFMPNLIGGIVLGYIWQILLNCVLSLLEKPLLALNATYGFLGLTILMCWQQIGYMMIIYIAGLQNIPDAVLEAAKIDGASAIETFIKITVPLMSPTIFFVLLITTISSFQVFDLIYLMTQGGPDNTTNILVYWLYKNAFEFFNIGKASAIAYVLFVLILILTIIQWKMRKKWVLTEKD
mgnify:CR=1 FL=1